MLYFFPLFLASTALAGLPLGNYTLSVLNNCADSVLASDGGPPGIFGPGESQVIDSLDNLPPHFYVKSSDPNVNGSVDAIFIEGEYLLIGSSDQDVPGLQMTAKGPPQNSTNCRTIECPGVNCIHFNSNDTSTQNSTQNSTSSFNISKYIEPFIKNAVHCDNAYALEMTFCPNVTGGGSIASSSRGPVPSN